MMCRALAVWFLAVGWAALSTAIELTFEMKTEKVSCFHERMNKSSKFTFEYQVVSGGQYDIDLTITGPDNNRIYHKERQQYDSIHETAALSGIYTVCFSNAFSTFAHKTIYFDWIRENEPDNFLPSHHTTLTQLEASLMTIHDRLKVVVDYQTHFRLREALGRDTAENMNERVMLWSIGEAVVLVVVSIAEELLRDQADHYLGVLGALGWQRKISTLPGPFIVVIGVVQTGYQQLIPSGKCRPNKPSIS